MILYNINILFTTSKKRGVLFNRQSLTKASSASGAALGYRIYVLGQNIAVYLNSIWTLGSLIAFFIAIIFTLLAIGIAGASIAIGMYFIEGIAYTAREIIGFLKITRGTGIAVTLIIVFFLLSCF